MDTAITAAPMSHATSSQNLTTTLRSALSGVVAFLIIMATAILVARRFAGALIEPLPAWALVAIGIVMTGTIAIAKSLNPRMAITWLLSIALILISFSVSLSSSSWLGLTCLWLLVVSEEIWASRMLRNKSSGNRIQIAWRHAQHARPPQVEALELAAAAPGNEAVFQPQDRSDSGTDWTDSTATQHLKYSRTPGGSVSIEGWLRTDFSVGQRSAVAHVAFCPAFSRAPQVEVEPLEGPDCEIRPTLALPWGIRCEVKLNHAATQPTNVVLGFIASDADS